jgi:hypothetical protein
LVNRKLVFDQLVPNPASDFARKFLINFVGIYCLQLYSEWEGVWFLGYKAPNSTQNNHHRYKTYYKKGGKFLGECRNLGEWDTHKGCKLSIPKFEAIVPVINGRRAVPPAPQADIHPIVPLTR